MPSTGAEPASPPSQPSHSGNARKTPAATSASPAMSRWRCSITGSRGRQARAARRARAFAGGLRALLEPRFGDVRAGGIGGLRASSTPTAPAPAPRPLPCPVVTVVSARGLVKTYGRGRAARRVLDGADIDARAGELVAVVGRSGSGKSTLLHLLGGLDRPEAGTNAGARGGVDGRPERELTQVRRRKVGFVFQFFHLIPELTGEENVLLPARLPGTRNGALHRGRELIAELGLADAAQRLPHELSGGEQQRLAVARALVHDPPLVL